MAVEVNSAPGRFPALTARMLRLELEAAGIAVTESGGSAPSMLIYVDSAGNAELRPQKLSVSQKFVEDSRFFKYPFRTATFVASVANWINETASVANWINETACGLPQTVITEPEKPCKSGGEAQRIEIRLFGDERRAEIKGVSVRFTEREYRLFCYLYERRGNAVSRIELAENVWDGKTGDGTNVVEVYVSYLRRKLEDATGERLITTRRGQGYVFNNGYR